MEKLKLVKPTKEYEKDAIEYIEEFSEHESKINGVGQLDLYLDNYNEWLNELEKLRSIIPDDDIVPMETFMLIRESDNRLIGMTNIRLVLNDKLLTRGGHIGYSIRPTERRKGYNSYQLYLALKYCLDRNIEKVLMTCDKLNLASAKTIQKSYGILENEIPDNNDSNIMVQRYWIDTNTAIKQLTKKYDKKK